MVNPDTNPASQNQYVEYIKQQLAKGYDIYNIRNFLIQKGYSQQEIDNAIDIIYRPAPQHIFHGIDFSKKTLAFLIIIVIILGLGISGILFYKITNQDTKETADSWSQTAAVSSVDSNIVEHNISEEITSEKYSLEETETVNKKSAAVPDTVKVYTKQTKNEVDLTYEAVSLAKTKPEEALTTCLKIIELNTKEQCLLRISKEADNYLYCARIQTPTTRDTCYMHFVVTKSEYSVCNQLSNEYIKSSCEALKRSARISEMYLKQTTQNIQNI